MPNPFSFGPAVKNPASFVGRKRELNEIFSSFVNIDDSLPSISIVGPSRVGKSSLLRYITNCYDRYMKHPELYYFVYIDLQDTRCKTVSGLFALVAEKLRVDNFSLPLMLGDFRNVLYAFRQKGVFPIVCLDEFEALIEKAEEFTDEFFDECRSLIEASLLSFILASHIPLAELSKQKKLTSRFFTVFHRYIHLGDLTNSEADELVEQGMMCDRPFSLKEFSWVRKLGGEHPYKLQIAGSTLYNLKESGVVRFADFKREFLTQWHGITGYRSPWHHAWDNVLDMIQHVGRVVWLFLQRKPAESKVYVTIGIIVVIVFVLLLTRTIQWKSVQELISALMGAK